MKSSKALTIGQLPIDDAITECVEVLERCCDVYFGLRGNQVSSDLLLKAAGILFEKYPHVTSCDIEHAFDRMIYEKKDWNGLKIHELMNPIYNWISCRQKIVVEFESFLVEDKKEQERAEKQKKYEEESLSIYRESLRQHMENVQVHDMNTDGLRSWLGTPFHANAIAKKYFGHQMETEEKAFIWEKAKERFYYDNKELEQLIRDKQPLSGALIGFTNTESHKRRIFSDEIIQRAIQLQLTPSEQRD